MRLLYSCIALISFITLSIAQSPDNALNFDGSNDRVSAMLPPTFSSLTSSDFTMEVWLRPTGSNFSRIIFAQGSASNFANISIATDNTVYFYVVAGGSNNSIQSNGSLTSGTWTHVAATWNATMNELHLFFDGIEQTTTSGGTSTNGGSNILTLGARPDGSQFLSGEMDEVRIWDHVRTPCEIFSWKNTLLSGTESGLELYYQFNEGVASGTNAGVTTLPDLSTNQNDGTLLGFALSSSVSNWVASAQVVGASVTNAGMVLTSNLAGGTYQWLDCGNQFSPIPGATQQSFAPSQSGNYAVQVTFNSCVDTSACEPVVVSGIQNTDNVLSPIIRRTSADNYLLSINGPRGVYRVSILDAAGRVVRVLSLNDQEIPISLQGRSAGIYTVTVSGDQGSSTIRFAKE
jgi:hypothetical protein